MDFLQGRSYSRWSQLIPHRAVSVRLHIVRMELHTLFSSQAPGTSRSFLASSRVPEHEDGPYQVRSGLTGLGGLLLRLATRRCARATSPGGLHQQDLIPSDFSCHKHGEHKREPDALQLKSPRLCWGPGGRRSCQKLVLLSLSCWKRSSGHLCLEQVLGMVPSSLSPLRCCSGSTFFQGYIKIGEEIKRFLISY